MCKINKNWPSKIINLFQMINWLCSKWVIILYIFLILRRSHTRVSILATLSWWVFKLYKCSTNLQEFDSTLSSKSSLAFAIGDNSIANITIFLYLLVFIGYHHFIVRFTTSLHFSEFFIRHLYCVMVPLLLSLRSILNSRINGVYLRID